MDSKQLCVVCSKAAGVVYCPGCKSDFCNKHYIKHRSDLNDQLEPIITQHGTLRDRIASVGIDATTTEGLITKVDNWEKEFRSKIEDIAGRLRQTIFELSADYQGELRREFDQFSKNIQDFDATGNFFENDLSILQNQAERLQREVYKLDDFADVVIDTNRISEDDWKAVISVKNLIEKNVKTESTTDDGEFHESVALERADSFEDQREASRFTTSKTNRDETENRSISFEKGQTERISPKTIHTIPVLGDLDAGTMVCHENQLMYFQYDDRSGRSSVTFLYKISQPDEKLTMNWPPAGDLRQPSAKEEAIRDIIYSDRLKCYLVANESCIYSWNETEERFREYHRMSDRQFERMTADKNFIYFIATANHSKTRRNVVVLLSFDKYETVKTFTDVIANTSSRDQYRTDYELTDLSITPHSQLIVTYRNESEKDVGLFIFAVGSRGQEWIQIQHLSLNDCWSSGFQFTPRVEWVDQLTAFVLTESYSGHLLIIDQYGQVDGECVLKLDDNESEWPINVSVSGNQWFCTRYQSAITVRRLN